MVLLAQMASLLLAAVQPTDHHTHGAVFGVVTGERQLGVYACSGVESGLAYDEGQFTSLSVKFDVPFEDVESLRAGATLTKNSMSFLLEGSGIDAGHVADVVFPPGTDMSTVAIDYTTETTSPSDDHYNTQLVPTGGASLSFDRSAFVMMSGEEASSANLFAFGPKGIRAVTLGFTNIDGVSSPDNFTGVQSFHSTKRSAIGYADLAAGVIPKDGPAFSTVSLSNVSASSGHGARLAAFDLNNENTMVEDTEYEHLNLVLIDGPASFESAPSPPSSPPSGLDPAICAEYKEEIDWKKTKDLGGKLTMYDENGEVLNELKGYANAKNMCSDLTADGKNKCKKAYLRNVTFDANGEFESLSIMYCKWKSEKEKCKDGDVQDLTWCVKEGLAGNDTIEDASWWASYGNAILAATVVILPVGAAYKLWRRRYQNRKEPEPDPELAGTSSI